MLEFDENTARALEFIYGTRDVLRRRKLVREALAAQPGEHILDIGCGPGFYVAELLEEVGPGGFVAGVDMSAPMLAIAQHRAEGHENVEFHEGDAKALPVDAERFDAAVCVQVLEYVPDIDAALNEFQRVLKPGGRLVVWDVDWSTASMHANDEARTERVLAAWDRHLMHRSLPRTLSARLRRAGFEDVSLEGHSFTTNECTPDAYGGSLVGVVATYLKGLDDFPDAETEAWVAEQLELGERGEFYFACVQCCLSARKPS